jgi:geranyl-CoA carboxylase beta subunit
MIAFESRINTSSDQFAKNKDDLLKLVEKMRALEKRAEAKSELRRPVFDKRGQLSPSERLSALLDTGALSRAL